MQTQIVLTSSQSKRLIARGIAGWEPVRNALRNGILAVAKGTTNSYVVEELLGAPYDKTHYVTGRTAPAGADTSWAKADAQEIIFEKGAPVAGKTAVEMVAKMGAGDVFLKGANGINYDLGQAAVLIGHPTGGTMGAAMGGLAARRVRLVHPVGLEKSVPGDLAVAARQMAEEGAGVGEVWGLWVSQGELFTEIEALETLYDVEAVPIAAGGIAGAEGSVTIALFGTKGELDRVLGEIAEIQKEPPFGAP